mmetsp:Transcript_112540/g.283019  ORF Transcript_112540/g.283019 Transcript_112540/m.283019 type:complete len:246 (-) Transcript_112540:77-814(-)
MTVNIHTHKHGGGQQDARAQQNRGTQTDEQNHEVKRSLEAEITAGHVLQAGSGIGGSTCVIAPLITLALHQRSLLPLVTVSVYSKYYPAVYVFRVGLISCGVLYWLSGIMIRRQTEFWWLCLVMGVGLQGLSAVSPSENNSVHVAFAAIYFVGGATFLTGIAIEAYRACRSKMFHPLFKREVKPQHVFRVFWTVCVFCWCCVLGVILEVLGVFGKHSETQVAYFELSGLVCLIYSFWYIGSIVDA